MMESNIVLKGSLKFIGLGELLQLLGGNVSTGRLTLTSPNTDHPGHIYLVDGNPVNAEAGNIKGLEALNRLFGWLDADYEFINEPVSCERVIKKSRMEIILDALRMVDDGEIEKVGAPANPQEGAVESDTASNMPIIKGPLVDYVYVVDEEEFTAGKEIVYQEKFGNWFWVILEGKADVIRLMPDGRVPISRLSDGAFIGSIGSFMRKGSVQRSATVVAVTDVQLGVMDYDLLFKEYSELTLTFQRILASLDNRLRQITTNCAKILLHGLPANYDLKDLKPFEQQNEEDAAYQIQNGRAVVVRRVNNGFLEVCQLEPNDVIGHIPFLNTCHEPHSATVYVSSDFEYGPIDLRSIRKEFDLMTQTFKNLIQHTTTSLSVTTGRVFDIVKGGQNQS
ncbi:MAG: cyclic nucleotide-binding domain-containing protein [Desulfobacterales bacterium]|nr:cyclic nucleotide-binding domain-containing protein [Desulfobacterales bacterium]